MKYVKQFSINGVDTKQVACIELQGAPNAATEGSVGVLGMDMTSPTHEVYRCVAVNGSIYTWELLSAGMSIMSAIVSGEGALEHTFPYDTLRIPNGYIVKINDLILDSEGYLYQITTIGNDSCTACYCGTHIGGIASGDKDCSLQIKNGKLCLVTESGKVLSEVSYITSDNVTLYRNPMTGVASVLGVKTISGSVLHFFVGTQAEYEALTDTQKKNLFAIISDDNTKEMIFAEIQKANDNLTEFKEDLSSGAVVVNNALIAAEAKILNGVAWNTNIDPVNGGLIISVPGVYLLVGYTGPENSPSAWFRDIVVIPSISAIAYGSYGFNGVATYYLSSYASYDPNDLVNRDKYRLSFGNNLGNMTNPISIKDYKAYRIMEL